MQQILAARQDELAATQGLMAQSVIDVYKALGGGWQARTEGTFMAAGPEQPLPPQPARPEPPAAEEEALAPRPEDIGPNRR